MKNKILTMSREQLRIAKNNISMSNASREKKTELYEMIERARINMFRYRSALVNIVDV